MTPIKKGTARRLGLYRPNPWRGEPGVTFDRFLNWAGTDAWTKFFNDLGGPVHAWQVPLLHNGKSATGVTEGRR